MESKIKEIQSYFISKILNDGFKIVSIEEYTIELMIDNKYRFFIWIKNYPENRKPYEGSGRYFMQLRFTQKQALKCHSVLKKHIDNYNTNILIKEKKKKYEELKKELGL